MAVSDLAESLQRSEGPKTAGDFLASIADGMVARMEPVVDSLGEDVDGIEASFDTESASDVRKRLRELRDTAIVLKRYLRPQMDVMARLQQEQQGWLSETNSSSGSLF